MQTMSEKIHGYDLPHQQEEIFQRHSVDNDLYVDPTVIGFRSSRLGMRNNTIHC